MGRKNRRNHSNNDADLESPEAAGDPSSSSPSTKEKFKDMDFAQRRELQRQQAAAKRRAKQKCYLCGQAGHVRRQCPGIADDGRGMSRLKGKSNKKAEKQKYLANREGRSGSGASYESTSENLVAALEYPEDFRKDFPYVDVHCDITSTIEFLRSGRGKSKISEKEAIAEYQTAINIATEKSKLNAVITKTFLTKPNRPWINPISFEVDGVDVFFALGLSEDWKMEGSADQETATQSVISSLRENKELIAAFAYLDMANERTDKPGMDPPSQVRRLQCCWEAAGRAQVPLQVQVSPGAASLDPEVESVAETDYAKALLELQGNLTPAIKKYPDLQVHLVGWTGRAKHMMTLLQAFPKNLAAIGLDGAVSFSKATYLHECAFEVPLDKLILETSNVIPSNIANAMGRLAFSQSGWWPFLVETIVKHKKFVTMDQVTSAVYETSLKLYPQLAANGPRSSTVHPSDNIAAERTTDEDNSDIETFFVYGTLRESGTNRHVVSDFVASCIKDCYITGQMFHYSPSGGHGRFPFATENGNEKVIGELLTVTDFDTALEQLDALEGYPYFYYRKVQTVHYMEGGEAKSCRAWVYFMQPSQECRGDPIPNGDWINHGVGDE